jgi:hypothetical protein
MLRDEVYSLRYRAYRKEDVIEPSAFEAFEDQYDHQPNQALWALTYEDEVIASIRTTWFDPAEPHPIPEMHAYREDLAKIVANDACILSGNRLVLAAISVGPPSCAITLRPSSLATSSWPSPRPSARSTSLW